MSRTGQSTLPGPLFVTMQNTLYRNWGKKLGAVEMGAFLSTLVVSFLARGSSSIPSKSERARRPLSLFQKTGRRYVIAGIISTQSARYSR